MAPWPVGVWWEGAGVLGVRTGASAVVEGRSLENHDGARDAGPGPSLGCLGWWEHRPGGEGGSLGEHVPFTFPGGVSSVGPGPQG